MHNTKCAIFFAFNYNSVHKHDTGRYCLDCKSKLKDTIINFGENLPDKAWDSAEYNAEKGDLCLAMGSSLTVTPAADLPKLIGKKGKKEIEKYGDGKKNAKYISHHLCIVNLQRTPLDKYCQLRIFAKCDDVMKLLMEKLGIKIPKWYLTRFVRLNVSKTVKPAANEKAKGKGNGDDDTKEQECLIVKVNGIDRDETPATIFKSVKLINQTKKTYTPQGM